MTDQLPERVWIDFNPRDWPTERIMYGEMPPPYVAFVPDDTAIPRAEADAMVAAAFMEVIQALDNVERKVSDGVAWCDWNKACHYVEVITPADARVAFEQAVREAREEGFSAGREKGFEEGRAMAHQHDKIFDEVATEIQVREAVEAERERVISFSLDGGPDLRSLLLHYHEKWVTETEAEAETDRHLAAIRAPEETSE